MGDSWIREGAAPAHHNLPEALVDPRDHDADRPMVAAVVADRLMVWQVRLTIVAFGVAAIVLTADLLGVGAVADPPPAGFAVAWVAGVVWVSYWWGFRLAVRVELTPDDEVAWRCALRRDAVPVETIVEISSSVLLLSNVIRHRGGRVLVFWAVIGFPELVAELQQRNPAIEGGLPTWMLGLDRAQRKLLRIWPWRALPRHDTARP